MTTFKLFHTNKTQQLTTEMFSMAEMERKDDIFISNQCRFTVLLAWKDDGRWLEVTFMPLYAAYECKIFKSSW